MAKVFISHSSADKELVDLFKNIILNAGLGIADEDIAYTSAVETGVPTGGNIPQYIKDNLADCDFVFFMISENYRKSEVCLNEMGAAWALNKNVKPILLYDVSFTSVGWLYSMTLCAKIDDSERLDELRDDFVEKYQTRIKTAVWNKNKAEFLSKVATLGNAVIAPIRVKECSDEITVMGTVEELGLLDYSERSEASKKDFIQSLDVISNAMRTTSPRVRQIGFEWQSVNKYSHNAAASRKIMISLAKEMDFVSKVMEVNAYPLQEKYKKMIDDIIAIQQSPDVDVSVKINNRQGINNLKNSVISTKDSIVDMYNTIKNIKNVEQSQVVAKRRLLKALKSMLDVCDSWIAKTTELLIA